METWKCEDRAFDLNQNLGFDFDLNSPSGRPQKHLPHPQYLKYLQYARHL